MRPPAEKTASQLLLRATSVLVIDAVEELQYLLFKYPDILIDNPKGIYQVGNISPILQEGQRYYTRSGLNSGKPITDIENVNEAVFDVNGHLLINDFVMARKRKFLSNESKISKAGLHAVYCFINKKIEDNCAYSRVRRYDDQFIQCFKPDYHDAIRQGEIDVDLLFGTLNTRIQPFIEKDPWTIYFVKKISTLALLEKTVDFRIYDWTLQQEMRQAEENDSES